MKEKAWLASLPMWEAREQHGIGFEHVTGERLSSFSPALVSFTHGTFSRTG